MTHIGAVTQSRTHCATASWGKNGTDQSGWCTDATVMSESDTTGRDKHGQWGCVAASSRRHRWIPEKKNTFSVCVISTTTFILAALTAPLWKEMLKQNKTFTYFGNPAWWENLNWYFADNKATLSILTFLDTHPGNICCLSKKINKKNITAWTHDLEMSVMSENKL